MEVFFSEFCKPSQHLSDGAVEGTLQFLPGLAQLLADGEVLGAVLFAFAAADAVGGRRGIFPEQGADHIVHEAPEFALLVPPVIGGEGAGDVHIFRAGHAVAAAGAAHLHFGIDGGHHLPEHGFLFGAKLSDLNGGGGP